ncbi:hypothetical protein [Candidatus Lokiarchaeum ossiferum]|uniref:hypothetical protein n=1 Tax=Candidatus Lokiarchaeum ossiferum TaxID=2951803 RepID=UPI00352F9228
MNLIEKKNFSAITFYCLSIICFGLTVFFNLFENQNTPSMFKKYQSTLILANILGIIGYCDVTSKKTEKEPQILFVLFCFVLCGSSFIYVLNINLIIKSISISAMIYFGIQTLLYGASLLKVRKKSHQFPNK